MEAAKAYNILAVDDEARVLDSIREILKSNSQFILETAISGKEAINLIKKHPRKYAVILVDFLMPDMNGAEINRELLT